jgi:hypothetical protein
LSIAAATIDKRHQGGFRVMPCPMTSMRHLSRLGTHSPRSGALFFLIWTLRINSAHGERGNVHQKKFTIDSQSREDGCVRIVDESCPLSVIA